LLQRIAINRVGLNSFGWLFACVLLLAFANYKLMKEKSSDADLKVIPVFHLSLLFYVISMILGA